MTALAYGAALTFAILALLPSKKEQQMAVPIYSIGLAVGAGFLLALAILR